MSNILKAIYEDIEEYVDLCEYYNEEPVPGKGGPDCYGPHAHELKERRRKEKELCAE